MIDKHPRIKSTASILRKYEKLQAAIKERLNDPNITGAERAKLAEQLYRMTSLKNSANDKLYKAMISLRQDMLNTPLTKAQIDQALARIEFVKGPGIAAVRNDVTEYIKMFNGRGVSDVADAKNVPLYKVIMTKDRASADLNNGRITTGGDKTTTFHEITHLVEGQRQWMVDFAKNWMRERAFSEGEVADKKLPYVSARMVDNKPVYPLNQLANGLYKPNEVAYADTFLDPYMGKVYDGKNQDSTEVWTMALQHFANPGDMVKLFHHHPDLFEVGVGLAGS
jgi:hypothetical protein